MKFSTRYTSLPVAAILLIVLFWVSAFGDNREFSELAIAPEYVELDSPPKFDPSCGEDTLNVSSGGYGFNSDLNYHTRNSVVIIQGVARQTGAAWQLDFVPGTDRRSRMEEAGRIRTPFAIEVSETHKGTRQNSWDVTESGGMVGCVSYRQSADGVPLFDGQTGLFFITAGSEPTQGNRVAMAIAEDGPDWFVFTEENFGSIEDAVELIQSLE